MAKTYSYSYDLAGRLTAATKNSANDTYTYDSNSNRLSATTPTGTSNGSYDAQDRLLTYGNASYTYTANGELASQAVGTQTTSYSYDVFGNLLTATLPNGTIIGYVIDAENRRVGRQVNGVLQTGFLYDGDRIVAQLNGANQVISQFVYATRTAAPDYMVNAGVTYRIFSDRLGSPVLVVNTSTGAIAEQIAYDEFGNVINDTNPGFQPFGFAGGLYDQDTRLVRFGARDYNPATGRWTAKDPLLFRGGSTNLFSYALNDPVNLNDPAGTDPPDAGTSTPDAGTSTPAAPPDTSLWDDVKQMGKDAWKWITTAKDVEEKCKTARKVKQVVDNGTEAIGDEYFGQAKDKVAPGAIKEWSDTTKNAIQTAPAAQGLGNQTVDMWKQAADKINPCPTCNSQPNAPNPRPPHQPGLNQYQNQ